MTDTYPHMSKINDLAVELINQLNMRQTAIYSEISYAAYDEVGTEIADLIRGGWDEESAKENAGSIVAQRHEEFGMETPYDDELETIAEALKVLQKLTAKD